MRAYNRFDSLSASISSFYTRPTQAEKKDPVSLAFTPKQYETVITIETIMVLWA